MATIDPRDDKTRIEHTNGGLLYDSYRWILDNTDFQRWCLDPEYRLLWIEGAAGTGKTKLLCGIINELERIIAEAHGQLVYFFCHGTSFANNSATSVLRGLLYFIIKQQPSLVSHLRERYEVTDHPFEGPNAWNLLSDIFQNILQDTSLKTTYLVIDALDECVQNLPELLNFIAHQSSMSPRAKWLVSCRNLPRIQKTLDTVTRKVRLSLELNEDSVSAAVTTYIRFKVDWLAKRNKYDNKTRDVVEQYLLTNSNGIFLWVSLVCQRLTNTPSWETQKMLAELPPGLNEFYRRMLDQIAKLEDIKDLALCIDILAIMAVVYRSITLEELATLVDTTDRVTRDYEVLSEIVALCDSFLRLRNRTISFVHQSAKDFLLNEAHDEIFPSGIQEIHHTIFLRSLRAMQKTLRRDMYKLGAPGFSIDKVVPPDPDPLATVRYSCIYWVNHVRDSGLKENANKDLQDGGSIDTFLREKYLYWLEALSLLRSMPEGIASILELEKLVKVSY